MTTTHRKKPVEIEARRLDGKNARDLCDWINGEPQKWKEGYEGNAYPDMGGISVPTLEGRIFARYGDWIIKGVEGEFYPCKDSIFQATYDDVSDALRYTAPGSVEVEVRLTVDERVYSTTLLSVLPQVVLGDIPQQMIRRAALAVQQEYGESL